MATLTKGKTFTNGELVTPQKLHELVDLGTISGIVNADISASAAIADTKLAQITTANKVAQSAVANLTSDLAGKAAASHTHTIANVTGLQTALDGKQAAGSYAPATGIAPSAITGTAVITTDSRLSDARTPTAHTHDASAIASGTLANARTTATSVNTANTIVTRDGSGNFSAGTITATLSGNAATATTAASCSGNAATATTAASCSGNAATATTLQTARTINGVSFNGSANITVTADPNAHTHDDRYYTETEMNTLLAGKQASGSYAASSHTHAISDTTGLQTALDGKQAAGSYAPATGIAPSAITGTAVITTDSRLSDARTPTAHTHDDRYYTETEMNTLLAGKQAAGSYAASSHNHDASNITSGTLANARTTATSLSLETFAASNPLDAGAYAGQLLGKIAQFNSSSAALNSYTINTFGVTSYSLGANSGVYSINAVSKSGAALVQSYIGGILSNSTNTGVIYGTASDHRLKTNIEPLTGALARLAALPVHRFNWLGHTDSPKVDGFLAHEAQAIVPEAVTGTKDAVDAEGKPIHQGIDQSKLVPLLVAAVQELAARVAALEAR